MTSYIDRILDQLGEKVTIVEINKSFDSGTDDINWGDASISTGTYEVTAEVQVQNAEDEAVEEGWLKTGDLEVYISPNDDNSDKVVRGNYIRYNSGTYQIDNVIEEPSVQSGEYHIMVEASKT